MWEFAREQPFFAFLILMVLCWMVVEIVKAITEAVAKR